LGERDWLILSVLYKEKNITKTAQALYISQPALTTRLQQIEKYFNVTIVHRTRKGVHFTPEGEFLAHTAEDMLARLQKIKNQISNVNQDVSGVLSIGASSYFTMFTLPRILKEFKELYPNVEFKVTTTWSRDIFKLAYNQDIHIGFVSSDYGGSTDKYLLFEEPIGIASMKEFTLDEIPYLPRIDYETDVLKKVQIDQWWRENIKKPPLISMKVDKLATCKEMVAAGLGYAIIPTRILDGIDGVHTYMLRDKDGKALLRKTWMIYYADELDLHVAKVFIDFVKQYHF
jgi:DNA-binding transcriptional LysR family regulator